MNEFKNFIISMVPSSPAIYFALDAPSTMKIITSILLPVIFFILSKTVDVFVQLHFKRKQKNG